jgi:hypothetical protein
MAELKEELCPEHILQNRNWREFAECMLRGNPYRCVGYEIILIRVGQGARMGNVMCHLRRVSSQHALVINVELRLVIIEFKYYSELKQTFRDEITHQHAAELGVILQDVNADMPIDELNKLYEDYMEDAKIFVSGCHSS